MTVVFCEPHPAVERIRAEFPSVTVIDISRDLPDGVTGDVLFGGFSAQARQAAGRGVRWVQLTGTGIDNVPPQMLAAEFVTSARGASALAISEYVLATMGAFARGLPDNWLRAAPERWNHQEATTLAGATLAVFGFGGIGQRIARLALAFEMQVRALRRSEAPSPVPGVAMASSVADLVAGADHVVLAAPATAATHHVVNAETIGLMKPGVHLVNIARGSLVDQDALREALDAGLVARASLDVATPEPLPAGHWMYAHPRVFLTPHSSWAGPPFMSGATDIFCDNLRRYLAGEPLLHLITAEGY